MVIAPCVVRLFVFSRATFITNGSTEIALTKTRGRQPRRSVAMNAWIVCFGSREQHQRVRARRLQLRDLRVHVRVGRPRRLSTAAMRLALPPRPRRRPVSRSLPSAAVLEQDGDPCARHRAARCCGRRSRPRRDSSAGSPSSTGSGGRRSRSRARAVPTKSCGTPSWLRKGRMARLCSVPVELKIAKTPSCWTSRRVSCTVCAGSYASSR